MHNDRKTAYNTERQRKKADFIMWVARVAAVAGTRTMPKGKKEAQREIGVVVRVTVFLRRAEAKDEA